MERQTVRHIARHPDRQTTTQTDIHTNRKIDK